MTRGLVALCADSMSIQHPEALGLKGERLASQGWLRLFCCGEEARRFLRSDSLVGEVWVASSDDVAPINLAATIKRDRPDRCVSMLAFEETGSLKSRVSAAGIDAHLTRQAFVERYAARKRQQGSPTAGSPGCAPSAAQNQAWPHEASGAGGQACSEPSAPRRDFEASGDRPRPASPPAQSAAPSVRRATGFLFPVVSGSGGAGKSTVAALSACIAQGHGYNTLLLDFDLQFGDAPALLGVQHPLAVDELLAAPGRLDQLKADGSLPALLAAPRCLEDGEGVVGQAPALVDQLLARFDVVVANTGAAWAEQHALLLERSSKALFLVDQRPSSLRACQHALDLCGRCGIATGPFLYAVNRCSKNALFTSIDVSCALRGAHVFELKDGGGDVEDLLGAGMPLDLLESRSELCASIERMLIEVLPDADALVPQFEDGGSRALPFGLLTGKRARRRKKEAACL